MFFSHTIVLLFILTKYAVWNAEVEEPKTYEGYKGYRVVKGKEQQMRDLYVKIENFEAEVIVADATATDMYYLVSSDSVQTFETIMTALGLKYAREFEDFMEIIKHEKSNALRSGFTWNAYYDIDAIYDYLQDTNSLYPDVTSIVKGGDSFEGRSITGLRIMTAQGNASKPAIIIESGIHAREWITPAATTYLIHQLLTSDDQDIISMRNSFDWHIFPSVNPDGYHYSHHFDRMWRKTRSKSHNGCRGADPNRNWDHNWGQHSATSNPCDYNLYAGSEPFSEVETRTFSAYISRVENLMVYVGVHADAQMLLVPYSDSVEHFDNYDDLIDIGKKSLEYGQKVNDAKYDGPATAAEILYKASGGSMDWVREVLGTPLVYTYELRGKYFHWPPSRIPEQGDELIQMMLGLLTGASDLGYF